MLPNLDKLVAKCKALGLEPKPAGKKLGKEDCVRVLREFHLPEGGLPYEEVTPMLCFADWNLKESEQKEVWEGRGWAAQVKLNGCRVVLHFVKDVGVFAHSRTVSLKTYRYQELTDQLLIKDWKPSFSATMDAEVMVEKPIDTTAYTAKGQVTKTSLHSTTAILHLEPSNSIKLQKEQDAPLMFHVFDVMKIDGCDLRRHPFTEREGARQAIKERLSSTEVDKYFVWPELVIENRRAFFEKIVKEGGEGVILKRMSAPYEDNSSRLRTGWVKAKKRQEYDAFVTGFKRGEAGTGWEDLVGALEFSVFIKETGETHAIGWGTNLDFEQRKKVTVFEDGEVKLHPALYGKVAEISGQDISARELRLSHCTIDRWRPKFGPDAKRKEECVVSMEDLKAAAEWVG